MDIDLENYEFSVITERRLAESILWNMISPNSGLAHLQVSDIGLGIGN